MSLAFNQSKRHSSSAIHEAIQEKRELLARLKKEAELIRERFDLLPISNRLKDPNERNKIITNMSKEEKARYESARLKLEEYLELYAPIKHLQEKRQLLYAQLQTIQYQKRIGIKDYDHLLHSNNNQEPVPPSKGLKKEAGAYMQKKLEPSLSASKKKDPLDYKNIHYVVR